MPLSGWARPFQELDLGDDPGLAQTMSNAGLCRIGDVSVVIRVRLHFVRHNQPEPSDASGAMILLQVRQGFARIWDHVKMSRPHAGVKS
jgi:hypothetical protein